MCTVEPPRTCCTHLRMVRQTEQRKHLVQWWEYWFQQAAITWFHASFVTLKSPTWYLTTTNVVNFLLCALESYQTLRALQTSLCRAG